MSRIAVIVGFKPATDPTGLNHSHGTHHLTTQMSQRTSDGESRFTSINALPSAS